VSGILSVIVFEEACGPLKVAGALIVLGGLVLIQRTNLQLARRAKQKAMPARTAEAAS
jgi:hypothetical protein